MKSILGPSRMLMAVCRRAGCALLIGSLWLGSSDLAVAAAKKKPEPEAAPTKSYTVPYMLVVALIGMGIMAIGRPSNRLDKVDDKVNEKTD
ncbi:MAG TPA: hypothetical protein VHV08_07455 [Pirellulales bacterium]|jgi:hypothetical protein|nr:hypothetical protein [Pirellulales bacterium]